MSSSISLSIGERYLSVVDVRTKGKMLVADSVAFNELSFNPYASTAPDVVKSTSDMLLKLYTDAHIKNREVHIVIPDSQSYTRVFEMPMLTDKELISAIKYQADQFIPIPIDKVSLDIHILKRDKKLNKTLILLVAAPNTVVESVVKIAESASLLPESIENETSSLLRLLSVTEIFKSESSVGQLHLVVNFGNASTSICLYDPGEDMPMLIHNFGIGRNLFFRDIQGNFSLTDEQTKEMMEKIGFSDADTKYNLSQVLASPLNEFVAEIKRFLVSAQEKAQSRAINIHMCGEGTKVLNIDKKVSQLLGMPVALLDLSTVFTKNQVSEFFVSDWPLLSPAVGSALR